MSFLESIIQNLPEVSAPLQKKLPFNERIKWTLIALVLFFTLSLVPLFGLGENALQQFEFLSIILGASFGSIISLGIGPLVTASIVLQLLSGTGILKLDLTSQEGRKKFQGLQKLLGIFFVIFEACIYVFMGGLAPGTHLDLVTGKILVPTPDIAVSASLIALPAATVHLLQLILVFQLILGGFIIMFLDELVSKWGIGSGISLFIAAGVAQQIFIRAFNFLPAAGSGAPAGAIPALIYFLSLGETTEATLQFSMLAATILVFLICVFFQSMKVEIPLSFERVRGYPVRWPLNFFYTSNIPVILVSALIANIQLFARLLENWGHPLLGTFSGNSPASGLVYWLSPPQLVQNFIKGSFGWIQIGQSAVYVLVMMVGAVVFSIFWMQTAGMDPKTQAKNILNTGLQMQGFRRDERILERVLSRYIWPLTILGGAGIGLLASVADLSGALSQGTGILLTVMIVYKLYEEISKQHLMEMNPALRKFME